MSLAVLSARWRLGPVPRLPRLRDGATFPVAVPALLNTKTLVFVLTYSMSRPESSARLGRHPEDKQVKVLGSCVFGPVMIFVIATAGPGAGRAFSVLPTAAFTSSAANTLLCVPNTGDDAPSPPPPHAAANATTKRTASLRPQ